MVKQYLERPDNKPVLDGAVHIKIPAKQLSADQIIDVTELFMTEGIHRVTATNRDVADYVMETLLMSMNYHSKVGYIALEAKKESPYEHIIGTLTHAMMLESTNHITVTTLKQFFLQEETFDFIWIEETPELIAREWYAPCLHQLRSLQRYDRTVIILVDYLN